MVWKISFKNGAHKYIKQILTYKRERLYNTLMLEYSDIPTSRMNIIKIEINKETLHLSYTLYQIAPANIQKVSYPTATNRHACEVHRLQGKSLLRGWRFIAIMNVFKDKCQINNLMPLSKGSLKKPKKVQW